MVRFMPAGMNGTAGVFGAIAGGSRSGKTLTALRIMRGIVGPEGRIYGLDTEGGRMSHYAQPPSKPEIPGEKYHFLEYRMKSPFSPSRFSDIIGEAEADGADGMVVDSFSLEWTGVGGVLDMHDQELKRLGGEQKHNDKAWAFAKRAHKMMRDIMLQSSMPVIFCIRSNEQSKHLTKGKNTEGTWKAEQDTRFIYEWTFALTLHPNTPGMPRYDLLTPQLEAAWKMPPFLRPFFPEKEFITEAAGEKIRAWRNGEGPGGAKRTVRELVADRCLSASDEEDVHAILMLPSVQKALKEAPEDVKAQINASMKEALDRIAAETKRADAIKGGDGPDDAGPTSGGPPDDGRFGPPAGEVASRPKQADVTKDTLL